MELLLRDDVPGLGARGDIVKVAKGYARNYLLPNGLAEIPTPEAIEYVRKKAEKIAAEMELVKADRMEVAKTLATVAVTIAAKASEEGHLYGSVGAKQIVDAIAACGHELDEKQVVLEAPLKEVGEFDVTISLHPEVQVPVKVTVEAEED
ncbi:MAG: 50S ribosomal protein L9 [Planctomycetota bacterium]